MLSDAKMRERNIAVIQGGIWETEINKTGTDEAVLMDQESFSSLREWRWFNRGEVTRERESTEREAWEKHKEGQVRFLLRDY